jgi:hypothetical protein
VVGRARAVGALLLADDEQEVDALLTGAREAVGRTQHGGRDPLRVRAAAAVESVALEPRRVVRRHVSRCVDRVTPPPARVAHTFPRPGETSCTVTLHPRRTSHDAT